MTSRYEDQHWIQRSNSHHEHWDQSPWPAQLIDSIIHSDNSDLDDDETPSLLVRHSSLKTPSEMRSKSTEHVHFIADSPASSGSGSKPSYQRAVSYRQYRNRSNSVEAPFSEVIIQRRRLNQRNRSTTEPEASKLHIDTILPVRLPPVNLQALSPVNAYPCSWWTNTSEADSLRRSESTHSFLSASSDGSWHGDQGDEDPDKQLDDALARMSATTSPIQKTKDGLVIHTYDYDEEDELHHSLRDVAFHHQLAKKEDSEEGEINLHAGLLMSNIAHYFLDDNKPLGLSYPIFHDEAMTPTASQRTLTRSTSDSAFAGTTSSISQLDEETSHLRHHRRLRAATDAPIASTSAAIDHHGEGWAASKLQALWQWFLPTVDDHLEHNLFGYSRPSLPSRSDSVPSLTSMSTSAESNNFDEEDFSTLDESIQGPLYDLDLTTKKDLVPKSSISRSSSFVTKGAPSPLWDNSLAEEPYQRTWSSMLGLTSM